MARIMIIDDQAFYRDYLAYELRQEGHRICSGPGTDNILEAVDTLQPDIVLIDPFYRDLSGYRLVERLKEEYPHLPVILMSVYDSGRAESDKVTCDGYAMKSVDTTEIKSTIHELLIAHLTKGMEGRCLEYSS
ncbi:MAG: response regulator [Deltaproteobacteria bacterium]|nr:response regulator [Deltaproteobacteria bacterium]